MGYLLSVSILRSPSCRLALIADAGEQARFRSSVSAAELCRVSFGRQMGEHAHGLLAEAIATSHYARHEGDLLVGCRGRRPTRNTLGA